MSGFDLSSPSPYSMQILHDYKSFHDPRGTTLTIGNFDGIHLGHQKILDQVVLKASSSNTSSVVLTFDPHPMAVLHPSRAPHLITTMEKKIALIQKSGIDFLLVLPFDQALSALEGKAFVEQILLNHLQLRHIFVGNNFHFGHHRSGNNMLLEQMGVKWNFCVHSLPEVIIRRERVSSTWIRRLIQSGRISLANRLLGRFYSLDGPVITGAGLGRKWLFPTLNLRPQNDILPKSGVYVTFCRFHQRQFSAVTNIGMRPTLAGKFLTVETHLLETNLQEPPDQMEIFLLHRLRDEIKFSSLQDLREQIARDCRRASRFFRLFKHPPFMSESSL
jgi:riboflavin kinase/FMN adenylyltransferase